MTSQSKELFSDGKNDFMESLFKYLKNWPYFLITLAICLGVAYTYVFYTIPQYKITSTLLIQEDEKGDGVLKGTAFSDLNMFKAPKTVQNEIEVLRSRDLIYQVLKELNLETSYVVKNGFKEKQIYGDKLPVKVIVYSLDNMAYKNLLKLKIIDVNSFSLGNDEFKKTYRFNEIISGNGYKIRVIRGPAFKDSYPEITLQFKDLYTMSENYSTAGITILPVIKDANTIILTTLDEIPQRGVDILNKLIENYNSNNVDTKNLTAKNTIDFIDKRLKFLAQDLSGVEQDVERYKQINRVTEINADAQASLQNSGNYDQQLSVSNVQLSLLNSVEDYLNQNNSSTDLVPNTLGVKDVTLTNLINRYNDQQIEKQRLLRTNKPGNPLVVSIDEQLGELRSNIIETVRNVKRGVQLERNNLLSKSSQYESMIRNVPVIERGLLERSREQGVKLNLYHYLLQKREETALSLSATIPTSQVIDKPAYQTVPAKPKKSLIYLCAMLLGFVIPSSVIYGKSKLNTKVNGIADVDLSSEIKVLGELSHKDEKNAIVVKKGSRTTISELFRYIRHNLRQLNDHEDNRVFLVTSGIKGEGKTFFSINLGITLSMVNKKVIILEFDLRKPNLLNGLNLKSDKGIANYLEGENIPINEMILPSDIYPGLYVMGCGKLAEDPAELLLGNRIDNLFEELKQQFDYIIVDTSPIGYVADAFTISKHVDASIYLIRYNYTQKTQLGVLDDIVLNNRLKNLMLVFNDAKKNNRNAYGYGGYAAAQY